jgi:hypothetical protein
MKQEPNPAEPLTADQVNDFITDGFIHLQAAFSRARADECVRLLWPKIGCASDAPGTWTRAVVRHPSWDTEPFSAVVNTPRLHAACNQLVGRGRWLARRNPGLIVIRFPSESDPGDAGWHIDGSFDVGGEWWVNVQSRGRALLMLFLFTDVSPDDAPTKIYIGSHLDVPTVLAPYGERGTHFETVVPLLPDLHNRSVALATGEAGDVYLCHPFLVHAATWPHRGAGPRFIAQPDLLPVAPPIGTRRCGLLSRRDCNPARIEPPSRTPPPRNEWKLSS